MRKWWSSYHRSLSCQFGSAKRVTLGNSKYEKYEKVMVTKNEEEDDDDGNSDNKIKLNPFKHQALTWDRLLEVFLGIKSWIAEIREKKWYCIH